MAFFCGIIELSGDQSSWCQLRKCQNKEKKEWIKQTGAHVAERAMCCLISLISNARCVAFHQSCSFNARLIRSLEAYVIWSCIDLFVTSCLFFLSAVLSPASCWPLFLQAVLQIWQLGLGLVGWEVSLCDNKYISTFSTNLNQTGHIHNAAKCRDQCSLLLILLLIGKSWPNGQTVRFVIQRLRVRFSGWKEL